MILFGDVDRNELYPDLRPKWLLFPNVGVSVVASSTVQNVNRNDFSSLASVNLSGTPNMFIWKIKSLLVESLHRLQDVTITVFLNKMSS